ncbi:4Fe-4S ferredoxin, iron-sulfur binding domain protein [Luminiphilus syltensis NOR5-1B]|uniref:4Fe-4S ferredoxin, iron-sulfur binding domain protein n=1 Tax=Luminiphilus syltensis NOR5-1B TaxID=565045 RepID=B8KXU0_9GAMM|nr:4Fe-4S ferredoxin, iron-sulfur binding domain protein [Luminiphilus syltensis NOR5-1B]
MYAEIDDESELPIGWTDEQEAGTYRLKRSGVALFGYVAGAQSWKPNLFQPQRTLWTARGNADGFVIEAVAEDMPRQAFLGVRACELKAISIQDHVLADPANPESDYVARRQESFIVAVNCAKAGATCFCVSMDAGPGVEAGYDLALTELIDDVRHDFLVEIGSPRGASIAARLPLTTASGGDIDAAEAVVSETAAGMGRTLNTVGLKSLLQDNPDHAQWDDVAARCLSCGNCTFACPTCFCHSTEDVTTIDGEVAERQQRWDSCFSLDFSYIRGGAVRPGVASRYRQWMTHKLANWFDQFGESGCVGCGRCITWCPSGIDITAEAAAIRDSLRED